MFDVDLNTTTTNGQRIGTVYLRSAPFDARKLVDLSIDMGTNGWNGRPVVLVDGGDHHIALTGSHRLAAVSGVGCEIEAVIIGDFDISEEEYNLIDDANDDNELLAALSEVIDGGNKSPSIAQARDLLRQEVDSNNDQ